MPTPAAIRKKNKADLEQTFALGFISQKQYDLLDRAINMEDVNVTCNTMRNAKSVWVEWVIQMEKTIK